VTEKHLVEKIKVSGSPLDLSTRFTEQSDKTLDNSVISTPNRSASIHVILVFYLAGCQLAFPTHEEKS
jgi:hypothetical protein